MKPSTILTAFGLLTTLTMGGITPAVADGYRDRASDQSNKNNMRNLTIGAAAVAAYGLFSHNSAATLLGAAGAALAGSQYEKDRKQQSQDDNRYYYRDGQNRYNGGHQYSSGNQNGRDWNNSDRDYQSRNRNRDQDQGQSHTWNR